MASHLLVSATILLWAATASAADLTKIDRSIGKEPTYKSKSVKYCLLVFGPEAKTRVWLAQDHDTLYVDRNGNGDLAEDGERIAANKEHSDADDRQFQFDVGDIRDGKLLHKSFHVAVRKIDHMADLDTSVKNFLAKQPGGRGYDLRIESEMPPRKGSGLGGRVQQRVLPLDDRGVLQFADRPQDAPLVHFAGPWQVTLSGSHRFTAGRESEVVLVVGTRGVGSGTTACVAYEDLIPEKAYPKLEVTFASRSGEAPLKESYLLQERC